MNLESTVHTFDITPFEETQRLGALTASFIYPGLTVLLLGNLGTGKTEFMRHLGEALGTREVRSPSFILVNEYATTPPVAHADLYRLETPQAVEALNLHEYPLQGWALFVEWGERWETPPEKDLWLFRFSLDYAMPQGKRMVQLSSRGEKAQESLEKLLKKAHKKNSSPG